jgi:murein L,D-transpeptidase YcbB/YkuD
VKNSNWKKGFVIIVACIWVFELCAQITPGQLRQFVSDSEYSGEITQFYNRLNYQPVWIRKDGNVNCDILVEALKRSADLGLQEKDYSISNIEVICNDGEVRLQYLTDSLEAELLITKVALQFYKDIAYGNTKPPLGYNGLNFEPNCQDIPALLADHILNGQLPFLLMRISPSLPEIPALESKIKWFRGVMADSSFREVTVVSNKIARTNMQLIIKLYQLGIIDSVNKSYSDSSLKQKVKEAQRQFSLVADGVLRSTIVHELNIPVAVRFQQLNLSLNYYRWFYCLIKTQSTIVVNLPSAYLKVYHDREIVLDMRMIVGKRSTPTPTLLSKVDRVILYPYWHVPYSIATKELLPDIKRNPGYIDAGNYQVLDKAGKIVDPYSVNWHAYSRNYFPFVIRQSTGCDNALGLLKLDFYNPFGVYLHDTPTKSLFMLNKRYFSHGCMRMEKPMELGHLVLKNNQLAIDTLEQKGCLRNQAPILVPADEHMQVLVWYNPAGVDSTGRVLFYEDVYEKFNWMRRK